MKFMTNEEKQRNLWRCDCPDTGVHISKDYHWKDCNYVIFLEDKEREEQDLGEDQ